MFASSGEATPPCGVPVTGRRTDPSSSTPARSIARRSFNRPWSLTRSSTAATNFSCGIASKEAPTHYPYRGPRGGPRGHYRSRGGGGRMTSVVVVTRRRHPLEGQSLRELGRMRRHGRLELLLVLPDGSKSLIPAAWTDLDRSADS